MKIEGFKPPKSSFLSVEKDMEIIVNRFYANERLKRLLYYTTKDALYKPDLSPEETDTLFGKNIKIVPKLYVDPEVLNYVAINFDKFIPNLTNPEFRDNVIEFDIVCHTDQWHLKDFELRPYKIAAEIDSMLSDTKLTGIGRLEFAGATQTVLNDEFSGLCLLYYAIHGGEDKTQMPNPQDQEQFEDDYEKLQNNLEELFSGF